MTPECTKLKQRLHSDAMSFCLAAGEKAMIHILTAQTDLDVAHDPTVQQREVLALLNSCSPEEHELLHAVVALVRQARTSEGPHKQGQLYMRNRAQRGVLRLLQSICSLLLISWHM